MYFYKLIELNRKEKNVTGEVKEIPEDEKKYYEKIIIEEIYKCDNLDITELDPARDLEKLNVERCKYKKEKELAISNRAKKIEDEDEFIKNCKEKKKLMN